MFHDRDGSYNIKRALNIGGVRTFKITVVPVERPREENGPV
jgi:hypothetical protein